ncbi:MAG: hypothetical protein KDD35_02595 [Bdellovibrionales bacterium]|nr:hypothetical protein [Bdellovibrionales bacterium]
MNINLLGFLFSIFIFSLAFGCSSMSSKSNLDLTRFTKSVSSRSIKASDFNRSCPKTLNLEKEKGKWQELIKLANGCVQSGRWPEVETIAYELARSEPNSPWAVYYLSLVSFERGEIRRSLWMIESALAKTPGVGIFLYQKSRVLWEMKDVKRSFEALEESLGKDSQNVEARLFMGQILLRDLDYNRAVSHLAYASKEKPRDPSIWDQLSYCYFKLKRPTEGLEAVKTAIQIQPKRVDLRIRMAEIQEEQAKDLEGALDSYRSLKSLVKKATPAEKLSLNLDEKIKVLEEKVSQRTPANKEKVSLSSGELESRNNLIENSKGVTK